MPQFNTRIFDIGLIGFKAEATTVYLCSTEPSTWSQLTNTPANSGYRIGSYYAGPNNIFGELVSVGDGVNSGRYMDILPIVGAPVQYSGNAAHYVIADDVNQQILLANALNAPYSLRVGGGWSMGGTAIWFSGWQAFLV